MVRMENESNLQVTFSKRRAGLFKKASELCMLCGAEMALIVFSPGNKVFSFGNPSVDSILSRYAGERGGMGGPILAESGGLVEAHMVAALRDLNQRLTRVTGDTEAERTREDEIGRLMREPMEGGSEWWHGPIDGIGCHARLRRLEMVLRRLKKVVTTQTDRIVMHPTHAANAASLNLNTPPFLYNNINNIVPGIAPPHSLPLPPFITADNNNDNNRIGFGNNGGHGFY